MTEELARYTEMLAEKYREKIGGCVTPNSLSRSGIDPRRKETIVAAYKKYWEKTGNPQKPHYSMPVEKYAALRTGLLK